jgi:hypothetical protein
MDRRSLNTFHLALYDLDRFRQYAVENEILAAMADIRHIDDVSLLKIGFDWVKREVFG